MTLRREYMTLALEMNRKFAEGKAEGKAEAVKNLMETMNITAEQAMKALKIPDADFAKYLSLL